MARLIDDPEFLERVVRERLGYARPDDYCSVFRRTVAHLARVYTQLILYFTQSSGRLFE